MQYKVTSVEFGDTVVLDNGDKYRSADSIGRSEILYIREGDKVELLHQGVDTFMRRFGGNEFKVTRA